MIKKKLKKKKSKSYGITPPCVRAMAMIVAVDHDHIYDTDNFLSSKIHQSWQKIQEISFNMKLEPFKITMKEAHNSEINSCTETPVTLP